MNYTRTNNILGWITFIIASAVYILTLEPSVSFWDCGEFISAAYKLQIVHQPGAPLFLMIQKMFSLLAGSDVHKIAYWMNVGSALCSAATILFLFWTITALAKKAIWKQGEELTKDKLIIIMGSGLVGALAYTFSDSFWFSAVESEVYAMSSLCTAIVFWAILKWDAHADEPFADRWLIFIAYVMGLSIGVHLLNLLAIPAIALVYYFRRYKQPTAKGTLTALFTGIIILGFIQYGVVQYLIKFAAYSDLFFVNTLGSFANTLRLSFGIGAIFYPFLLTVILMSGSIFFKNHKWIKKYKLIIALINGTINLFIFYYSCYWLLMYTSGTSFGLGVLFFAMLLTTSLATGIIYTIKGTKASLLIAVASFVALMTIGGGISGLVVAAIILAVLEYALKIRNKKRILNLALISVVFIILGYGSFAMIVIRAKADPTLNNSDPDNAFALLSYVNREQYGDRPLLYGQYFDSKPIDSKEGDVIYRKGKDKYEIAGKKFERLYDRNTLLPRMYSDDASHAGYYRDWMGMNKTQSSTFADNIGFLFSYQTGFMYARYFAWNFIGRQNDEQGHGDYNHGNWLSGIKSVDAVRLGSQDNLPQSILSNKAYNRFFFLPFIIGLIGAFWHFKRNQKDAGIVGLLFFFTGLAIVLYLNQTPLQPRERDYAYSGSFYAFAIWIGLGVAGIAELFRKKISPDGGAIIAVLIGLLAAPVIMAKEGWDDHDRSTKFTTRDIAIDYLESCAPNAILFTYGDNDTYPLWYVQEVENIRPDVRIVNLSLLGTDWYIRQMKEKVNQSDPLPITMSDDKYVQGVRDVLYYQDYELPGSVELKNLFEVLTSDDDEDKTTYQDGSKENFLPTKNFKMTVNPDEVIATKTVPADKKDDITPALEWEYNKGYVSKTELAIFDILAHNNWKRPVYFAITVPQDNYMGLDNYLYNEGFAYRLLPLKKAEEDSTKQRNELTNTAVMYNNMMNKFKWGNIKNARYLDPESVRMISLIVSHFNILAENLYKEGRIEEAKKVLDKCLEVVPDKNYSLNFTIRKYYMANMLYQLKEVDKANKVVENTANYIEDELNYLISISKTKENLSGDDIELGMSILNGLIKTSAENGQPALSNKLQNKFKALESKLLGTGR